jgi:hypothetical protein
MLLLTYSISHPDIPYYDIPYTYFLFLNILNLDILYHDISKTDILDSDFPKPDILIYSVTLLFRILIIPYPDIQKLAILTLIFYYDILTLILFIRPMLLFLACLKYPT